MTRIVAGSVGGRSISVPDSGTRPTTDRTREALFSRLEHEGVVDGARVLDLYAGSGALGLEAASRGAAHVTLVDAARRAAEVCRENVRTLGLTGRVVVVTERAERFLSGARPGGEPWDLVLLDPPYDVTEAALADVLAQLPEQVAPDAVVVVERSRRSPEPTWPAGLSSQGRKVYGEAALWFAEPGLRTEGAEEAEGADEVTTADPADARGDG